MNNHTRGTPEVTSPYVKVHHVLPKEVYAAIKKIPPSDIFTRNSYIRALRENEWSLQSLGDAFGMTRERARQIANGQFSMSGKSASLSSFPLPEPPLKPVKEARVVPEPSERSVNKLLKLQPLAQQVRSHSPKYRKEAEEYTALINQLHEQEGVPLARIADILGVTTGALRFRLARYGYMKSPKGGNKCYKPILKKNRFRG